MKYEVVIRTKGSERVVATTRRERGAIAERDRAVESEYWNKVERAGSDPVAHAVRGSIADDPNAEAVVYFDGIATIVTVITYRQVPPPPVPDTVADDLLASIIALDTGATL